VRPHPPLPPFFYSSFAELIPQQFIWPDAGGNAIQCVHVSGWNGHHWEALLPKEDVARESGRDDVFSAMYRRRGGEVSASLRSQFSAVVRLIQVNGQLHDPTKDSKSGKGVLKTVGQKHTPQKTSLFSPAYAVDTSREQIELLMDGYLFQGHGSALVPIGGRARMDKEKSGLFYVLMCLYAGWTELEDWDARKKVEGYEKWFDLGVGGWIQQFGRKKSTDGDGFGPSGDRGVGRGLRIEDVD